MIEVIFSMSSFLVFLILRHQFYIRVSAYRNSRLKKSSKIQLYADIYILLNYSTCFGRPTRPSSEVHKTVVAASGTDHTVWGASLFPKYYELYQRLQLQFYILWYRSYYQGNKLAPQIVWSVPELQLQFYVLWYRSYYPDSKLAPQIVWSVAEAAITILYTPDDRRDGRPKHVE